MHQSVSGVASRRLLLSPSLAWLALFFLAPLCLLLVFSFGTINPFTFEVDFGWTIENYQRLADPLYLNAIVRSLSHLKISIRRSQKPGCSTLMPSCFFRSRVLRT